LLRVVLLFRNEENRLR